MFDSGSDPSGLPGGNRTPDPQLRRLLLYPTELRAVVQDGRGDMIRTCDPLLPKQMRYQTALRPDLTIVSRLLFGFTLMQYIANSR